MVAGDGYLKFYPQLIQFSSGNTQSSPAKPAYNYDTFEKQSDRPLDKELATDINSVKDTFESFRKTTDSFKKQVNELDNKSYKNSELTHAAFAALSPIVPLRRISSLPDNIEDGNYERAAGLVALAVVNLPEDTRDLGSAARQMFKGELPKYDYKNCQTPFSFFRGTALQPIVNKMGKFGVFLHKWDMTLAETKFGEILEKLFKFKIDHLRPEETERFIPKVIVDSKTGKTVIREFEVMAYHIEGKPLANLVGKALLRIPVISVVILALLEIPNIVKKIIKANGAKNKAQEGSKQTLKSTVNVVSIQAGISLIGALLTRKGPAYSLLGMGIGSVIGAFISKGIQKGIDGLTDEK